VPLSQIAGVAGHLFATMNLYSTLVVLHVVTAIFGLGPLASLAVVTTRPSSTSIPADRVARILRLVSWSLLGMFLTGVAIVALTHGALGQVLWMRVSIGLFVVLGLLLGLASRQIRRALRDSPPAILPKALNPLLWSMCGLVVTITYLMEAKPW
jgi:hypothetical protein